MVIIDRFSFFLFCFLPVQSTWIDPLYSHRIHVQSNLVFPSADTHVVAFRSSASQHQSPSFAFFWTPSELHVQGPGAMFYDFYEISNCYQIIRLKY